MTDLPEPMSPKDCDLRGYEFMPLFGQRLFGSKIYTMALRNPRAGLAALKLWWASWQQCPAGSLPDDDEALCHLADFGIDLKAWGKVKQIALHGFILCSDGRLYHPVVCAEAAKVWVKAVAIRSRENRRLEIESGVWADIRSSVFRRDDFQCVYCGDRGGRLECDHVIPISKGGVTHESNLVTACRTCNRKKGSSVSSHWGNI